MLPGLGLEQDFLLNVESNYSLNYRDKLEIQTEIPFWYISLYTCVLEMIAIYPY